MLKKIQFDLHMYIKLVRMTMRGRLQYRVDFWTSLVGVFILNGVNIAQIGVLSWRFTSIGGWSIGDLMILYGMFSISWSLYTIFFVRTRDLGNEITTGIFDQYLIRPMSPFLQFISREFQYVGLCDSIWGLALVMYGYHLSTIRWSARDICLFLLFLSCGAAIMAAIQVIIATISFWTVRAESLQGIIMQLTLLTQKYPISLFGKWFKTLVTCFIPVAFLNYYPIAYLLRKTDVPIWISFLSPAVMILLCFVARTLWKYGSLKYESTGS